MGYFLLYEAMLDSVIFARDKWLRRDGKGIIFPDKATMYFCGIEDREYREEKIGFWRKVHGFNMEDMVWDALAEPLVAFCPPEQVMTNIVAVASFDLYSITRNQLDWQAKFQITAQPRNSSHDCIHALVGFFDVNFSKCIVPLGFITGPFNTSTHWKQSFFYLENELRVKSGDMIDVNMKVFRNAVNPRDLDICMTARNKTHTGVNMTYYFR
eukprot:gnl/MRDRNA2_/MRDRNA2_79435_c0_seq1.p1 gnl/MRDRNA2_/MRDRNA2_79435_c0~~gnl/MRDRNA2_/MRDRNA2_79435_c0_seq1.p1  ORF type:complete len:212 (-),score=24.00 gnl/MRDRNA2_/MRDRNA2_79435_c0_seq1:74-709(-)